MSQIFARQPQKISINSPITTARPIKKITPIVPPINFNMLISFY
ncbi:hypothetical protein SAMN05880593_12112 [Rhizobium sp. RU36D]|nr:hypothetical protein SAMN05880593_12112 [Rhizobium sp. RU36D]